MTCIYPLNTSATAYVKGCRCTDCKFEWGLRYKAYTKTPDNRARANKRRRNNDYLKKYGLTTNNYEEMLSAQNNGCAICFRPATDFKYRLAVDHCHDTTVVRGLLCASCNSGIGKLSDSIQILQRAIEYLRRYEKKD